ncbi:MAG: GH32 C-terminal domain-containing protein [Clostridiales bacterium]|jgi:beta-fructofuranosidase|nr:GH32 C-terminal domain-containing protein [Clostridiales bacterium]
MYTIKKAELFIKKHSDKTDDGQRPKFHLTPPVGWINDPNGLCFYKGEYHVFAQYHPYNTRWGSMHWYHAKSKNLIEFERLPVALAPDEKDEDGCYSGGATVNGLDPDELILFYTKARYGSPFRKGRQEQAKAVTRDGINFTKLGAVIGADKLPEGASAEDFRDPKPVYRDGKYYVFVGGRDERGRGVIFIFVSDDLNGFGYFSKIDCGGQLAAMGECPDAFRLDGREILLASVIKPKTKTGESDGHSVKAFFLNADFERRVFAVERVQELDCGDYYAPQTLLDDKNRRISIAWMGTWNGKYYPRKSKNGYCGALTLPVVLSVGGDGLLRSEPIAELDLFRGARAEFADGEKLSKCLDLIFEIDPLSDFWARLCGQNEYIEFGAENGRIYYASVCGAAKASGGKRYSRYAYTEKISLRVITDVSTIEIFVDSGRETISSRFFLRCDCFILRLSENRAALKKITAYELSAPPSAP